VTDNGEKKTRHDATVTLETFRRYRTLVGEERRAEAKRIATMVAPTMSKIAWKVVRQTEHGERYQGDLHEEVLQIAWLRLLEKDLDAFDPERGVPFEAYLWNTLYRTVKRMVTRQYDRDKKERRYRRNLGSVQRRLPGILTKDSCDQAIDILHVLAHVLNGAPGDVRSILKRRFENRLSLWDLILIRKQFAGWSRQERVAGMRDDEARRRLGYRSILPESWFPDSAASSPALEHLTAELAVRHELPLEQAQALVQKAQSGSSSPFELYLLRGLLACPDPCSQGRSG